MRICHHVGKSFNGLEHFQQAYVSLNIAINHPQIGDLQIQHTTRKTHLRLIRSIHCESGMTLETSNFFLVRPPISSEEETTATLFPLLSRDSPAIKRKVHIWHATQVVLMIANFVSQECTIIYPQSLWSLFHSTSTQIHVNLFVRQAPFFVITSKITDSHFYLNCTTWVRYYSALLWGINIRSMMLEF